MIDCAENAVSHVADSSTSSRMSLPTQSAQVAGEAAAEEEEERLDVSSLIALYFN